MSERIIEVCGSLNELRAAVNVLKLTAATQLDPDDPMYVLEQLQSLEKAPFSVDSEETKRRLVADQIDAIRQRRKTGVQTA